MQRADTVVVGGGIIGLAVAFALSQRGQRVTVLEAERIGERAAAGVAAGMLAPASEADLSDSRLTRLALASHALYAQWVDTVERASGLPTGFDRTGTLFVALHANHLALLEHLEHFQREQGIESERLSGARLREIEPLLAPGVAGGLHLREDWQVDPRLLLRALHAALTAAGSAVIEQTAVRRVAPAAGGYTVDAEHAGEAVRFEGSRVVMTAGAWTRRVDSPLAGLPLLASLPVRPVKGQLLRLRGERLIGHIVRTPDVYMVPRGDGELVAGATMEEQGFDRRSTAGAVYELLRHARAVLPGITELELTECNVGFRPALRDHLPAIGATAEPNLFVAVGHFRNGVELAPITADLLANLICEGRADPLLDELSPLRFETVAVRA